MASIEERIARRLAIPAFAETKVVAVDQNVPRVVRWSCTGRPGRLLLRPAHPDPTM